jgi:hypothetical protein
MAIVLCIYYTLVCSSKVVSMVKLVVFLFLFKNFKTPFIAAIHPLRIGEKSIGPHLVVLVCSICEISSLGSGKFSIFFVIALGLFP